MKIAYFESINCPPCRFVSWLQEQGLELVKVDYTRPRYLEGFDVVIIEQNGFNDYIENDEEYFQDYIRRGGICLFMHQDYQRWAPHFLPGGTGYTQLIHRYVSTVYDYKSYLMPTIEKAGMRLFSEPCQIFPDEMIYWKLQATVSSLPEPKPVRETVQSAALSCFLPSAEWEVLGSYQDPAVKKGALILQAKYGKGLYFLNQILFPEVLDAESTRVLNFWTKYVRNLFAHFARFKSGDFSPGEVVEKKLPLKRNYKLAIHMHSLDWYGCDSSPGTINAIMRYKNMDICAVAVKDTAHYDGDLDISRYSDDKVLFLHGQEYHPFNWNDSNENCGHNTYHLLAIGMDDDSYTAEFTRSLFSDAEIDAYLRKAIRYIHDKGGVACATHPWCDYWYNYNLDAVDMEELRCLEGSDIEKYWLSGTKITIMNSVDLFGARRMLDNPAVNFIYPQGVPSRKSVVAAIKAGHCIAAVRIDAVDISLGKYLPGDTLSRQEAVDEILNIKAVGDGCKLTELRIYSGRALLVRRNFDSEAIDASIDLSEFELNRFIRVEISGEASGQIAVSTPFYLE